MFKEIILVIYSWHRVQKIQFLGAFIFDFRILISLKMVSVLTLELNNRKRFLV